MVYHVASFSCGRETTQLYLTARKSLNRTVTSSAKHRHGSVAVVLEQQKNLMIIGNNCRQKKSLHINMYAYKEYFSRSTHGKSDNRNNNCCNFNICWDQLRQSRVKLVPNEEDVFAVLLKNERIWRVLMDLCGRCHKPSGSVKDLNSSTIISFSGRPPLIGDSC